MPMGGFELLIVLAIILLFFGARRLPELGRSLGLTKQEFRKAAVEDSEEAEELREGKENEELSSSGRGETRAEEGRARAEHEEEGNTDQRTEQRR
jgi:sec-independent protein translocase protein TatA